MSDSVAEQQANPRSPGRSDRRDQDLFRREALPERIDERHRGLHLAYGHRVHPDTTIG